MGFDTLLTDTVSVLKQDGERFEGIKAAVDSDVLTSEIGGMSRAKKRAHLAEFLGRAQPFCRNVRG